MCDHDIVLCASAPRVVATSRTWYNLDGHQRVLGMPPAAGCAAGSEAAKSVRQPDINIELLHAFKSVVIHAKTLVSAPGPQMVYQLQAATGRKEGLFLAPSWQRVRERCCVVVVGAAVWC